MTIFYVIGLFRTKSYSFQITQVANFISWLKPPYDPEKPPHLHSLRRPVPFVTITTRIIRHCVVLPVESACGGTVCTGTAVAVVSVGVDAGAVVSTADVVTGLSVGTIQAQSFPCRVCLLAVCTPERINNDATQRTLS